MTLIRDTLRDLPSSTLARVLPVLRAMSSTNGFFVTGAGMPIPIIPTMDEIARLCLADYHEQLGGYPVTRQPWTAFRQRLLSPLLSPSRWRVPDWKDFLMPGIYEAALEALFHRQLERPLDPVPPVNYRVFEFVPAPAVFFDLNLDGLLPYYCEPPHLVLNPHGTIDRAALLSPHFEEWLRDAADFGLPAVQRRWQVLPGPESSLVTRGLAYNTAAQLLAVPGAFVALIGYSFGRQHTGTIDDGETFEFLRELLRRFPRQVVVVDPNPAPVVDLLENALHERVLVCELCWNHLAAAACGAMDEHPFAPNLLALASEIAWRYDERTR